MTDETGVTAAAVVLRPVLSVLSDEPSDAATDDGLMTAVALGDAQAFGLLVGRHLAGVHRLCHRLLDDRGEAEDVAQESFTRLWQSAPNWRSVGGGLPAWLHRVASNLCFDRLRRGRGLCVDELPDCLDESPDALRLIEAAELEGTLDACLRRLPAHHRAALVLSYYEGHSNAVAAQILDMNLKAFESLLLRARRRMADELRLAGVASDDLAVLG